MDLRPVPPASTDEPKLPPASTKAPLEVKHSDVKFAVFGSQDQRHVISLKSEDAPLELLGFYPLEAIEISSKGRLMFLWELIDFSSKPVHWVMSLEFRLPDSSVPDRLVLLWQGLATKDDKLAIKKVLDRHALDVAEATMRGDYWSSVISISSVIAECRRAEYKNKRVRTILWACATVLIIVGFALVRCY